VLPPRYSDPTLTEPTDRQDIFTKHYSEPIGTIILYIVHTAGGTVDSR